MKTFFLTIAIVSGFWVLLVFLGSNNRQQDIVTSCGNVQPGEELSFDYNLNVCESVLANDKSVTNSAWLCFFISTTFGVIYISLKNDEKRKVQS